jgi:uncharacterized protein (DUF1499 family)
MNLLSLKPIPAMDFADLSRPASPNTYLLCPAGFSASPPDQEAPIYTCHCALLITNWEAMISDQPRTVEHDRSDDGLSRTYVQRSLLVGYPDIISVQFIAKGETECSLAVYSRSQYGHSDFGVNRRRVLDWLANLEKIMA